MSVIMIACVVLIALTTVVHYEALTGLNVRLLRLRVPVRSKLLVVIFAAFIAHAMEICLYGGAYYGLDRLGVGSLSGPGGPSVLSSLYFSAETYSSVGFGDIVPLGPMRMLAGVEALNGLLLLGWTASFTYLSMERFWRDDQR